MFRREKLLFQSFQFAAFLLCILCIFFLVPAKMRVFVLLLANMVFFAAAAPSALIWLLFSILSTYGCALILEKQQSRQIKQISVILCVGLNLVLLVIFRYLPEWDLLINAAYGKGLRRYKLDIAGDWGLVAPLGISFYTLQALGYLLDVSAGKYPAEKKLDRYAVFVSFFPNIASGPIERGSHFLPQLEKITTMSRKKLFSYDRVTAGGIFILWGFFLKMVVADRVSVLVDYLYGIYQNTDSFTMLMAALFYSMQIYCDFASYSCIAAGVAKILGFELVQNFCQPYFALGIRRFWKRWHISLSRWLRDYIYIPLGGSRRGFIRRNLNVLITFLMSGLWHGGAPQYLVWGLLHGACQVIENTIEQIAEMLHIPKVKQWPVIFRFVWKLSYGIVTFLVVTCLWIFFRAESVEVALVCLHNLFTKWQGFLYVKEFMFAMGLNKAEMLIAVMSMVIVFAVDLICEINKTDVSLWLCRTILPLRFAFCLGLIAIIFVFGKYGVGYQASHFIYMQF